MRKSTWLSGLYAFLSYSLPTSKYSNMEEIGKVITSATYKGYTFRGCTISKSSFKECEFIDCTLDDCTLDGCLLISTHLNKVTLSNMMIG